MNWSYTLTYNIELKNIISLRKILEDILEPGIEIELNLQNVNYVDSCGVSFLINLSKKIQQLGGKLIFVRVNKKIRDLFEITDLYQIIEIR